MNNKQQCEEMLFHDWHKYRCSKNAKVQRDSKWYCTIHDPVRIKQKWEDKKAKYDKEIRIRQEKSDYEEHAVKYCKSKGLTINQLIDYAKTNSEGKR